MHLPHSVPRCLMRELCFRNPGMLKQFIADLHSGKLHREFHHGPDPSTTTAPAVCIYPGILSVTLPATSLVLPSINFLYFSVTFITVHAQFGSVFVKKGDRIFISTFIRLKLKKMKNPLKKLIYLRRPTHRAAKEPRCLRRK